MSVTRRLKPLPLVQPQVIIDGDWAKAQRLLGNIDTAIILGYTRGQKSAAKKIKRIVRRNIRENGGSIGWPPVSQSYAKYKSDLGYDPTNLMYMTGLYYRSIDIWNQGTTYYVGLKRHTRHESVTNSDNNLTLAQIARILENGSSVRNIKARPLWRPSYKMFGGNPRLKGLMLWHIRNQIYVQFGVRAKVTI